MARLPKAKFNLRLPGGKNETLIYIVFRYRGKRLVYSTGYSVFPKDWDPKTQRPILKEGRRDLWLIKRQLDNLEAYCEDIYIKNDCGQISIDEFKDQLERKSKNIDAPPPIEPEETVPEFMSFIDQELEEMADKGMRYNSLKTYRLHAKVLKDFAKDRGAFTYEEVDWNFRLELIDWLTDREVQLAYGNKTLSILRQFLERARRKKYHRNTDYNGTGWSIPQKKAKGQIVTLSPTELEELYSHDFKGFLEKVRDLFLIGAGTGQRFGDFSAYGPDDFYQTIHKIPILSIISQKTDTPAQVPLNLFPWLIPILEKYDFTSPKLSMQKFNEGIKQVCRIVGLDQRTLKVEQYMGRKARIEKRYVPKYTEVSSHTCRRSFATNLYRMGYTLAQIMPMTGHSTESQLREYIGIDGEQNAENIAMQILRQRNSSNLEPINQGKLAQN